MKKKIIVLFKNRSNYEFLYRNKDLCLELIKNFKNIKFINLEKKNNENIKSNYKKLFLNISNLSGLDKHLGTNKQPVCISFLEKKISNFKYFKFLNQKKIKLVEIYRSGDLRQAKYFFHLNLFDLLLKIYKILKININFLIFCISYKLKILPKTNILFHYNKDLKDQIGYSFSDSYKSSIFSILWKFFLNQKLFFSKIYLINPRSYDELKKKNKVWNKYIVFLDSCFDHNDRDEFDKKPNINDKINYYKDIKLTFKNVKNFIFCAHPNTKIKDLKFHLKGIKFVKFKTKEYIKKSKIVFFHESSSVLDALYLNKNIVSLSSNYVGSYFKFRGSLYSKTLKLKFFNISNTTDRIKIKEIIYKNKKKKTTNKIKSIYFINSKQGGLNKIIKFLKKYNN